MKTCPVFVRIFVVVENFDRIGHDWALGTFQKTNYNTPDELKETQIPAVAITFVTWSWVRSIKAKGPRLLAALFFHSVAWFIVRLRRQSWLPTLRCCPTWRCYPTSRYCPTLRCCPTLRYFPTSHCCPRAGCCWTMRHWPSTMSSCQ